MSSPTEWHGLNLRQQGRLRFASESGVPRSSFENADIVEAALLGATADRVPSKGRSKGASPTLLHSSGAAIFHLKQFQHWSEYGDYALSSALFHSSAATGLFVHTLPAWHPLHVAPSGASLAAVGGEEDLDETLEMINMVDTKPRRMQSAPAKVDGKVSESAWWNAFFRHDLRCKVATAAPRSTCETPLDEKGHVQAQRRFHVAKYAFLQCTSLLAFTLISANDTIVKSASKRRLDGPSAPRDFPYVVSSVLVTACVLSVVVGCVAAYLYQGLVGLQRCFAPRALLQVAPISMLFQFANVLKFISLKYLPADMVGLLSQLNLVLLAITMRFLLGKRYRFSQWIALTLTSLAMLQYLTIRDARHKDGVNSSPLQLSSNVLTGLMVLLAMCMVETLASVLAEKQLKDVHKTKEAFYVTKVHVDVPGLLFMGIWCFVLEPFALKDFNWSCKAHRCRQVLDEGFFSGWDSWTLAVLGIVFFKMWLACLVAKVLDSVVKQLGSCCATVLTYLEVVCINPKKHQLDFETAVALSVVVMSIANFAVSTQDSQTIEQECKTIAQHRQTIERLQNQIHDTPAKLPPPSCPTAEWDAVSWSDYNVLLSE